MKPKQQAVRRTDKALLVALKRCVDEAVVTNSSEDSRSLQAVYEIASEAIAHAEGRARNRQ